jgi:hypothetical protein
MRVERSRVNQVPPAGSTLAGAGTTLARTGYFSTKTTSSRNSALLSSAQAPSPASRASVARVRRCARWAFLSCP